MGSLPHMLSLQNIKEAQNYLPLKKRNWGENGHLYSVVHDKDITYIHTYIPGLDQLIKLQASLKINEVNVTS